MRLRFFVFIVLLGFSLSLSAQTEVLKLIVQPDYSPEQAQEVYKPLTTFLQQVSGQEVILLVPKDHYQYNQWLKQESDADLALDEPHITALRMQEQGFIPLVHTSEPLSFSLVSLNRQEFGDELDYVSETIVTLPSPSLGYLTLSQWFDNPMVQPGLNTSARSWQDAMDIMFNGEADAAIIPSWMMQRYSNLVALRSSVELPGITLSASPDLDPELMDTIRTAMLEVHDDQQHFSLLTEMNTSQFVSADASDYTSLSDIL